MKVSCKETERQTIWHGHGKSQEYKIQEQKKTLENDALTDLYFSQLNKIHLKYVKLSSKFTIFVISNS